MVAFLFIIKTFASLIQNTNRKEYNKVAKDGGVYAFSAASALFVLLFFVLTYRGNFTCSKGTVFLAMLFGIIYAVTCAATLLAIQTGPLSLSALCSSYSSIIPTIYGLVFLKEKISIPLIFGIVLLLVSIVLININSKKDEKKASLKWGIYAFITFFGNGLLSVIQRIQQMNTDGIYKNEFMIIALFEVVVILGILTVIFERDTMAYNLKRGFVWYSTAGLGNGLINYITMVLILMMPASVLNPLTSACNISLNGAVSVLVYKEKLSALKKLGFVLGLFSIIALNIKI